MKNLIIILGVFLCYLSSAYAHAFPLARGISHRAFTATSQLSNEQKLDRHETSIIAAVIPDPSGVVSGTFTLGIMNAISIFTYILYARFALSWFPQLPRQFPILRPINTVTEPYLRIFRQVIPPIGGFDISALPAIFLLDILSQTAAAIGDSRVGSDCKTKLQVWSNKKQRDLELRLSAMNVDYNGKKL